MRPALEWGLSGEVCLPHCGPHPLPRGSEQNKADRVRVCLLLVGQGRGAPALRPGLTPLAFLFSGLHTWTELNTSTSGALVCRGPIVGILSLHNHMSQSFLHNNSVYLLIYLPNHVLSTICPSIHPFTHLSIHQSSIYYFSMYYLFISFQSVIYLSIC